MRASVTLSAIALVSIPTVWSSHYKLNRYYGNNIEAQGTPSNSVILNSGECYSFSSWFGVYVQYFDGGWMVTCYDTIQEDDYGTFQISGEIQIQFQGNDGPSAYTCSAPTSTNLYDVYVPSVIYGTNPTTYSVYYRDGNTNVISQEFGSTSFECFEAVLPPEPSDCPFSTGTSGRRLTASAGDYHPASFNVSVNIVLGAGVDPVEWIVNSFSADNFSNPWKALDNDMIPFLNNLGTSVDGRRLSSNNCMAWGFACLGLGAALAAGGSLVVLSGGAAGVTLGGLIGVSGATFALNCVDRLLDCAVTATSTRMLTSGNLTEATSFTLSFSYQVATTLDSVTARAVFLSAIQSKLDGSIVDSFPTFALALSHNGTAPTNMTVSDAVVPEYSSDSNSHKVTTTNIIIIVCVVGGVLLLAAFVCLKRCFRKSDQTVVPGDEAATGDSKLYV